MRVLQDLTAFMTDQSRMSIPRKSNMSYGAQRRVVLRTFLI